MSSIAVIPARYASTRFPGKPLALIAGKPMLQWVLEGVSQSKKLAQVLVATDDARIAELVQRLGFEAKMTPSELPTGTDRVCAVAKTQKADIVLNIQGDEPLISGQEVDLLLALNEGGLSMATLATQLDPRDQGNPNVVKVQVDAQGFATQFSRAALTPPVHRHIGLYGYNREFLLEFCSWPQGEWEKAHSLEQLRALQKGIPIGVAQTPRRLIAVDRPEDVSEVEAQLRLR